MHPDRVDFLISRADLRSVSWQTAPSGNLQSGQARLKLDRFALTANNITYALLGKKFRYWDFFPAPEGYGRLPVWGFAQVEESLVEGLSNGERLYGYFPISTELIVQVEALSPTGFSDGSLWRSELSAVYNRYLRVTNDPSFAGPAAEALQAVFRPLFSTSFLIDDFLSSNEFFGAQSIIVSSASSKTSLALGYLLERAEQQGVETIGLTSASNVALVSDIGYFDRMVDYDDVDRLDVRPSIFVDMAGSSKLRSAIHHHYKDELKYSCAVGSSHWEDAGRGPALPGPKPTVFFAPGHVDQKIALWGVDGYEQHLKEAWGPFSQSVGRWIEVAAHNGHEAVEQLYQSVLEGSLSPRLAAMGDLNQ